MLFSFAVLVAWHHKGCRGGIIMILFLTFLVANHFFHEYVQISGIPTMILATILFYVAEFCIGFVLVMLLMGVISVSILTESVTVGQILVGIAIVIALCLTGMISILLLSKYLAGFWVSGKLTAFLLSFVPALLTTKVTTSRNQ